MAIEQLDRHEVFQFLRPDQVKKISDVSEVVAMKAGDTVYEMGTRADFFYIVLTGQVSLRLPGYKGISIQIDELTTGAIFGSCMCFQLRDYSLTAQCTRESRLLRISAAVLKDLMDGDLVMGYGIQTYISRVYFQRYIDTMNKLQSIVLNLPLEAFPTSSVETPAAV